MLAEEMGVVFGAAPNLTLDDIEADIEALTQQTIEVSGYAGKYSERWLSQFLNNQEAIHDFWIKGRELSEEVVDTFLLGWDDKTEAGAVPLRDGPWFFHGVIKRFANPGVLGKYTNPHGWKKSEYLFGIWEVEGSTVAVTEGPIDALKLWSAGIPAVSVQGSQPSATQATMLKKAGIGTVISFFDNDPAGTMATLKLDTLLSGIVHYVAYYPPNTRGFDPGALDMLQLEGALRDAQPFFQWDIRRRHNPIE